MVRAYPSPVITWFLYTLVRVEKRLKKEGMETFSYVFIGSACLAFISGLASCIESISVIETIFASGERWQISKSNHCFRNMIGTVRYCDFDITWLELRSFRGASLRWWHPIVSSSSGYLDVSSPPSIVIMLALAVPQWLAKAGQNEIGSGSMKRIFHPSWSINLKMPPAYLSNRGPPSPPCQHPFLF